MLPPAMWSPMHDADKLAGGRFFLNCRRSLLFLNLLEYATDADCSMQDLNSKVTNNGGQSKSENPKNSKVIKYKFIDIKDYLKDDEA